MKDTASPTFSILLLKYYCLPTRHRLDPIGNSLTPKRTEILTIGRTVICDLLMIIIMLSAIPPRPGVSHHQILEVSCLGLLNEVE